MTYGAILVGTANKIVPISVQKGPMTPKNMRELIKIAKKHGLKRLKLGTFEAEFFEKSPKRVGIPRGLKNLKVDQVSPPTEDELLFWSSGTDIKAEREFAEEKIQKQQQ